MKVPSHLTSLVDEAKDALRGDRDDRLYHEATQPDSIFSHREEFGYHASYRFALDLAEALLEVLEIELD